MKPEGVFKALSEPRRMELLRILWRGGEMSVGELSRQVDVTQQAVSLHLRIMEDAGIVEARRQGTRHLYAVRIEGFGPVEEFLSTFWPERLKRLKGLAEREND